MFMEPEGVSFIPSEGKMLTCDPAGIVSGVCEKMRGMVGGDNGMLYEMDTEWLDF